MTVRVAINGFGRIGRLVLRAAMESGRDDIEFVGVNDLGSVDTNAHLVKYDSVHGVFPGDVTIGEDWMDLGRGKIKVTAERDPTKLPWGELGIDIAMECTGIFTSRDQAAMHLEAGAQRVLVSAPASGAAVVRGERESIAGARLQRIRRHNQGGAAGPCRANGGQVNRYRRATFSENATRPAVVALGRCGLRSRERMARQHHLL